MDWTIFGLRFEIECGLLEFVIDFVHRFECVVLEDFLADLLPKIFLRVGLGRVGRQKLQPDFARDHEIAGAVVGRAIHE